MKFENYKDDVKLLFENIWNLLIEKQKSYGDTYSVVPHVLELLLIEKKDENGNYLLNSTDINNLLTIVRILDKLFRIVNGNNGNEDAWDDILGYCILEKIKTLRGEKR